LGLLHDIAPGREGRANSQFPFARKTSTFGYMSEIEIRPAGPGDLPAITAIYAEAVQFGTATFELVPPDLAEMTRRFEAVTSAGFPYLAGLLDGRLVGYAYAGRYHPRAAYRFTVENSIYLAPESHRRGVGTKLLQCLIDECEKLGFRQIIAIVGDSANAGSIGVHAKAGFQTIGLHPDVGYKFGRWLDIVMMQRALGGGGRTVPDQDPGA
jgi:phosphinothricin acetyltransferase